MEPLSQITFALNKMVDVNSARASQYTDLSDKAKEIQLKLFYMQYAIQAQSFTATLNKWRVAYGITGQPAKRTNPFTYVVGKMKKAFSTGNSSYDFKECEKMESDALKTYKTALALSFLPPATIDDITKQSQELEKVHSTLRSLCMRMNMTGGKSGSFNLSLQF